MTVNRKIVRSLKVCTVEEHGKVNSIWQNYIASLQKVLVFFGLNPAFGAQNIASLYRGYLSMRQSTLRGSTVSIYRGNALKMTS